MATDDWSHAHRDVCNQLFSVMSTAWSSIHDYDSILHQAAYIGAFAKLKSLLTDSEHQKLVNFKNRLGCTPLRLAATGQYF